MQKKHLKEFAAEVAVLSVGIAVGVQMAVPLWHDGGVRAISTLFQMKGLTAEVSSVGPATLPGQVKVLKPLEEKMNDQQQTAPTNVMVPPTMPSSIPSMDIHETPSTTTTTDMTNTGMPSPSQSTDIVSLEQQLATANQTIASLQQQIADLKQQMGQATSGQIQSAPSVMQDGTHAAAPDSAPVTNSLVRTGPDGMPIAEPIAAANDTNAKGGFFCSVSFGLIGC